MAFEATKRELGELYTFFRLLADGKVSLGTPQVRKDEAKCWPIAMVQREEHDGQSYYEIFSLGNSSGVVKFTSLHNQPSLRQMLTADFPIGRAKMRFAYIWDAQQSNVNSIKTHTYSHVFMVGFVKEVYLLKNKIGRAHV